MTFARAAARRSGRTRRGPRAGGPDAGGPDAGGPATTRPPGPHPGISRPDPAQVVTLPPLIWSVCPVIQPDSFEAR